MKKLLLVLSLLSILTTAGCGTTGNARIAGLLMGASTEEARKHLETLGRIEQCYESYNVSISGYGTRKVTIRYDCPREVR